MSNVYNRRLFKPRPARAKLNQMGGIMASSVPLMQSVQKFANGTSVRIPQDTRASNIYGNVSPRNLIKSCDIAKIGYPCISRRR